MRLDSHTHRQNDQTMPLWATPRQAFASLERAANAQAIILAVTCHHLTRLRPSGPIAERDQESDRRPRGEPLRDTWGDGGRERSYLDGLGCAGEHSDVMTRRARAGNGQAHRWW